MARHIAFFFGICTLCELVEPVSPRSGHASFTLQPNMDANRLSFGVLTTLLLHVTVQQSRVCQKPLRRIRTLRNPVRALSPRLLETVQMDSSLETLVWKVTPSETGENHHTEGSKAKYLEPSPVLERVHTDTLIEQPVQKAIPTENGGYYHTEESKAKIARANKGKIPWNAGKNHPEETKTKISESLKRRRRKLEAAKILERKRMQIEEPEKYALLVEQEQNKTKERRRREWDRRKARAALLRKQNDTIALEKCLGRRRRTMPRGPRNYTCSKETKKKISDTLKRRWHNNATYREMQKNAKANSMTEEKKRHLSRVMKELWSNGTFKGRREMEERSPQHRQNIADSIKRKWMDPEYRERVIRGIRQARVTRSPREVSPETREKLSLRSKKHWTTIRNQPGYVATAADARRRGRAAGPRRRSSPRSSTTRVAKRENIKSQKVKRTKKGSEVDDDDRSPGGLSKKGSEVDDESKKESEEEDYYRSPDGLLEAFFGY